MSETTDSEQGKESSHAYRDPGWVVLAEHDDRLDVAFTEDLLARAGIPSTTTRRVDGDRTVHRVMVTADDEVRARRAVGANVARTSSDSGSAKSPNLVWGLALIPGCAHFYAGETARGAVLLLALLSTLYWSRTDHVIVLAPFVLAGVDALGARAVLLGRRSSFWRVPVWTAPLWVAAPAVMLHVAPDFYIGEAGRAVCAAEVRCQIEVLDDCTTATATQIGGSMRMRNALSQCATFLEGRSCDDAYGAPEERHCETGPFCASGRSSEEAACIDVYLGTVEEPEPDLPSFTPPGHRGWGM